MCIRDRDNIDAAEYAAYQANAGANLGSAEFPVWENTVDANFSTFGINLGARFLFGSNNSGE